MTLFIERIEIRQQPEHKRYWADVEVRTDVGFKRANPPLTTPYADGRDGILDALKAYWDELDPPPPRPPLPDLAAAFAALSPSEFNAAVRKIEAEGVASADAPLVHREAQGDPTEWPVPGALSPSETNDAYRGVMGERKAEHDARFEDAQLAALRSEAEAAGVRVDGRWGEARLRHEIAAHGQQIKGVGVGGVAEGT